MLLMEGTLPSEMKFDGIPTWVLWDHEATKGFFTVDQDNDKASLVHFVTHRKYRSPSLARELVRNMTAVVRWAGFNNLVIHSKSEALDKCI